MAKTWTDITDGTLAAGQPIKTGVLIDLRDNDEANATKPFYIGIDVNATVSGTYTLAGTYYLFVPEDAKVLAVRGALWGASGTSYGKLRLYKIGSSSNYDEVENSNSATAKGAPTGTADETWTFSDLTTVGATPTDVRGFECVLEVYLKSSGTSVRVDLETLAWAPSRFSVS